MKHGGENIDMKSASRWGKCCADKNEEQFLKAQKPLFFDLCRLFQISLEFLRGFIAFRSLGPCVTVFGSARFGSDHKYYNLTEGTATRLAKKGFTILTGGGPGLMEAANKGAKIAGGYSVGCNITLPKEQQPNEFLDQWVEFKYFFVRKVMLAKYSYAFIVMPGGYGTLDEMFEILTLIQTGKLKNFPVILMGSDYWQPLLDFILGNLIKNMTINPNDFKLLTVTDSQEEAVQIIQRAATQTFGLEYTKQSIKCQ
ncbi:TIGR00730 family Rossman fold protein [bacterium]|nr:TIGR00730 family Rossman fold protein [bacterium]